MPVRPWRYAAEESGSPHKTLRLCNAGLREKTAKYGAFSYYSEMDRLIARVKRMNIYYACSGLAVLGFR